MRYGVKKSSQGHKQYWRGYKLHLDVADGQIPISAILQVEIQLPNIFEPKIAPEMTWAEQDTYIKSTVERVNASLKNEFGARNVRVRCDSWT
ncbi:MAG TPA: hypothetical protein VEX68_06785 [Bryobacteraceae bacterium]|nr:hypothetical protein [Bryobacteraceae bacterium]